MPRYFRARTRGSSADVANKLARHVGRDVGLARTERRFRERHGTSCVRSALTSRSTTIATTATVGARYHRDGIDVSAPPYVDSGLLVHAEPWRRGGREIVDYALEALRESVRAKIEEQTNTFIGESKISQEFLGEDRSKFLD